MAQNRNPRWRPSVILELMHHHNYRTPTKTRPSKGTSSAGTALTCQFWYRSVHRRDLCAIWRNQKKEERQGHKLTVTNCVVQPGHPRRRSDLWSCMSDRLREIVLSFKFHQNRLNGFRVVGGQNLAFPIPKTSGLYNNLSRTSRDFVQFHWPQFIGE